MTSKIIISTKHPIDLERTALSHGWVNLAPFSWNAGSKKLTRRERIGERTIEVIVKQDKRERIIVEASDKISPHDREFIEARVRRWLMLDWDPTAAVIVAMALEPRVANYIQSGGGRFLRGSTFFEDLYKTICTINTSWRNTVRMVHVLANLSGHGCAATPVVIHRYSPEELRRRCGLGYRAAVLYRVTTNLLDQRLIDENGNLLVPGIDRDILLGLKGIGPYGADHLRVLQSDFIRIPVDSEVRSYCLKEFGLTCGDINDFFAEWGDFRFLGYKLGRIIRRNNWIGD